MAEVVTAVGTAVLVVVALTAHDVLLPIALATGRPARGARWHRMRSSTGEDQGRDVRGRLPSGQTSAGS
jgi:hypothetical protein